MKKIIAIFCLLVMSVQVLPIKELGKCLYDNSFVEEECAKKAIEDQKLFSPKFTSSADNFIEWNIDMPRKYIDLKAVLLQDPVRIIISPPPNVG